MYRTIVNNMWYKNSRRWHRRWKMWKKWIRGKRFTRCGSVLKLSNKWASQLGAIVRSTSHCEVPAPKSDSCFSCICLTHSDHLSPRYIFLCLTCVPYCAIILCQDERKARRAVFQLITDVIRDQKWLVTNVLARCKTSLIIFRHRGSRRLSMNHKFNLSTFTSDCN